MALNSVTVDVLESGSAIAALVTARVPGVRTYYALSTSAAVGIKMTSEWEISNMGKVEAYERGWLDSR
jgi:hypothetical protein